MIFNIDKSRDSNLGRKLKKTPTPQGLEQTANPQVAPVVTPRLSRGGWVGEYIDCCIILTKHEILTQNWFDVDSSFMTLARHQPIIGLMLCAGNISRGRMNLGRI